jgi:AcrR family transcriptional regulator
VSEEKTRRILQAARDICEQQGVGALRMDAVAAAAGVAKGTLYLYFATKEDLVAALAAHELPAWTTALAQRIAAAHDPGSRAIARLFAAAFAEDGIAPRLLPHLSEDAAASPAIDSALISAFPELDSGQAASLWVALRALHRGFPHDPEHLGLLEEALANQIRGTVRGSKNKKR